jgi:restriction system protein
MAVPNFQEFFDPLLRFAADGEVHTVGEAREALANIMSISEEDRAELLPSGNQSKFDNRVAWAKSYFVQAKVLESPSRGRLKITVRGRDLLAQNHASITIETLEQYPEFYEFRYSRKGKSAEKKVPVIQEDETPEETLQKSYLSIRHDLANDLLQRIKDNSPAFFESLVVDLMIAMGYGGSRSDAGESLGKSGDEGIDGIIKEDRLGLDVIYLQAKRWEGTIGRPEIQKFVGALHGQRAKKGVFITTSSFSADARSYVKSIDPKVVLIDGHDLAEMMIDHGLGVSTVAAYEIKRVDMDYFEGE